MAKQPYYHHMAVLFTSTSDLSETVNAPAFRAKLERFLKRELGYVVPGSVQMDGVDAEPGDPADL